MYDPKIVSHKGQALIVFLRRQPQPQKVISNEFAAEKWSMKEKISLKKT